jgi:hypothetical protein
MSSQTTSSPVSTSSVATPTPKPITTKRKRDVKQEPPPSFDLSVDEVVDLTAESDDEPVKKKVKAKTGSALDENATAPRPAGKGKGRASEKIELTRQLKCDEVVELDQIPTCWTVSQPDYTIAYLLDLTTDAREWRDSKGELMSMATIIKSQVSVVALVSFLPYKLISSALRA